MKKIVGFILVIVFSFSLFACTELTTTTTTTSGSDTSETTTSNTPVTITYAAWNLGTVESVNLERLMIDAFMEEYPWITVEIIERPKVPDSTGTSEIDQNWNEFLGARAAQGSLPDVFFTDSTETTIMNNWAKDVTEIAHNDPEFMNISEDIREAANYGGKLMALPYAVYYFGYYINKTIFENENADAPLFEDTFSEFVDKIKDVANHNVTNGTGIAGIVGLDRMLEWYPAQLNSELGWYTYDGTLLHLDGIEFETTLTLYQTLMQDKTFVYDAMTPEEQLAAFGTTNAWESSQLAAYWEYTPIIGSMLDYDFEVDFIGTPGTDDAHQIPIVLDLMCISSQTQHLTEAYLLSKWMSFGKDGYLQRIAFSTDEELDIAALNMTPLQPDEELLDAFFAIYSSFTELRKVVEYDNYILEPNKYVPGYIKARWTEVYDAETTLGQLFDKVRAGTVNYADVKTSWNEIANDALSIARAAVFQKLGVTE
ncbi:MAG: hypothetical protein KJ971_06915 [Firmicutes bacterium]|nr:hypothetical protein [Bacillota bacterium]